MRISTGSWPVDTRDAPAGRMRFQGTVYRAHDPRWSWPPVSGEGARRYGGRFNRVGVEAFYTSLSPMTALREAGPVQRPLQPVLVCAYEVDAEPVFDALDAAQRREHAVTDEQLRCPNWEWDMYSRTVPASHALADRLVAAGFAGMRVPSFAAGAGPDDVNLVLWRWSGRRPSRVVLIDDEGRLTKIKSEFRDVHEPAGRRIAATDPRTGP